jgi:DNA-binding transcriptional ArsR family regulator
VDRIFAALGEPMRRRVLQQLSTGEQPAGAIVETLRAAASISQPAVSQHLKVLREAGLVTVRIDGARRLYALNPDGIGAAQAWLGALTDPAAPFASPLDALATEVARGKRGRRASPADPSFEQSDAEQSRTA